MIKKTLLLNYLVTATFVVLAVLTSCEKKCKNDCVCILTNADGFALGYCNSSDIPPEEEFFSMYPNPAAHYIRILSESAHNIVTITDKCGKEFLHQSFDYFKETLDVSDYPEGTYNVTIDDGKHKITLCLIKKNG